MRLTVTGVVQQKLVIAVAKLSLDKTFIDIKN